ncbi:MAG: glycosyltransferase family 9 protein [Fimbriimonadaceae bacterium]|nr:glycosyltransferase family 9 protein [Fimbriimonadaceae bacterium]
MHRYSSGRLGSSSRIALIANDALGNFAISSPIAQILREMHRPARLDGFTGSRVMEIAEECPWFDEVIAVYGDSPRAVSRKLLDRPEYDLVINVENAAWAKSLTSILAGENGMVIGPCANADGRGDFPFENNPEGRLWADPKWTREDLRIDYPFLSSGHIAEIIARCCYWDGPIPAYHLPKHDPNRDIPDVLMATTASLPEKLWPIENWLELAHLIADSGRTMGLLGAKPKDQGKFWKGADDETRLVQEAPVDDLRGELTLPQVVGALDRASLVVTLDNGILHFACSTQTPVVGLFRNGIHRLWAPPVPNLKVIEPGVGGIVADLPVQRVWSAINNFQIQLA